MKQINVVAAAIVNDHKQVLCFQRGPGRALANKWEFPGGKIELGETDQVALIREIQEELKAQITVGSFIQEASYDYDFGRVTMRVYLARLINDNYTLTEHLEAKWVDAKHLMQLDWAPVDIPIAESLSRALLEA